MDKVRFGIIGAGNMGTGHMNSFKNGLIKNAEVVAVADTDPVKLKRIKEACPGDYRLYASGTELIEKSGANAVIIATPHYEHPSLSIAALKKGLNVICEKPAGVYTKQVREMNAAADNSKGLFTVMFNQRTNPLYKKMREYILNGSIGEIKRINWIITDWYRSQSYYNSGSWRATWSGEGGGVLINQCPHQLDLLSFVTGLTPASVQAFCRFGKWHDIEVEDDVTAYLEYSNGASGVFVTSTADAPGTNRFEVLGSCGKLVAENNKLCVKLLKQDERDFNSNYTGGFGEPEIKESFVLDMTEENPQHAGIINNFVNAVLKKEPLFVKGQEGINGVALMNAMLLSTWLDKKIDMPFDDDLYFKELQKRVKDSRRKEGASVLLDTDGTYGGK